MHARVEGPDTFFIWRDVLKTFCFLCGAAGVHDLEETRLAHMQMLSRCSMFISRCRTLCMWY
jgi:hypothetical protein